MFGPASRPWPLLTKVAAATGRGLLGTLVPESCPLCGAPTPPDAGGSACGECESRLKRVAGYCRRCSAPLGPFLDPDVPCGFCRKDQFAFAGAFVADEYDDLIRSAVLAAKRAGGRRVAAWLADRVWECRGREMAGLGIDLVVPVPQHWTRRLVAPHNTAELIGRRLAVRLKARFSRHILLKVRRTPRQTRLTRTERRANLRGVFAASRRLDGRRVLLTDDVLTTGTTADRAARALLEAGAGGVWVAAAARGLGR